MSTKLILTSALALAIASPAFATPTSGSWNETTGNMWENTVYSNAATEQHTGITEGTVIAEAYYTWNTYAVDPGKYWPSNTEWGDVPAAYLTEHPGATWSEYTTCPVGYYCEGSWSQPLHYDYNDQFKEACPAGYNSVAGSAVIADCYSTATNNGCMMPQHARQSSSLTGYDYYAWGTDTCELVPGTGETNACANGYTYYPARSVDQYLMNATTKTASQPSMGSFTVQYATTNANSQSIDLGQVNVRYACNHLTSNTISVTGPNATTITKYADITNENDSNALTCYCQGQYFMAGAGLSEYYSEYSGHLLETNMMNISESPWRPAYTFSSAADCSSDCAAVCADVMTGTSTSGQSTSLMSSDILTRMRGQPTCEANQISITWRGATPSAIAANNAASTWYDNDVRTPVEAVTLPGKTFQGWRFLSKDNQGNNTTTPVTLGTGESMSQDGNGVIETGTPTGNFRPYDGPTPTDTPSGGNGGSGSGNGGY